MAKYCTSMAGTWVTVKIEDSDFSQPVRVELVQTSAAVIDLVNTALKLPELAFLQTLAYFEYALIKSSQVPNNQLIDFQTTGNDPSEIVLLFKEINKHFKSPSKGNKRKTADTGRTIIFTSIYYQNY